MFNHKTFIRFYLISYLFIFIWSVINPHDYFTWFLETVPAIIGIIILTLTYKQFRFTNLTYFLIWIHAIILTIGGHYTYAEVPLFNWIKDTFELTRNHYDRLGHFAQGFIPAIITREILTRNSVVKSSKWVVFVVISFCLAFSAFYELIEWSVAETTGTAAEAFLGTQGDIWDTQKDMALALIGAITSLLLLGKLHDKSIKKLLNK